MNSKMASTAKRWLIGCGIGCIGLVVLVIAAVVGFGMWIRGSGELLEPHKLLGADTTGHVEWTLQLEDPGTEGFAHALIDAVRAIPPETSEQMPPWMVSWLARMQSRNTEKDILGLFPIAAAWTVRPGAVPEDDLHLFSLSVERLGNRLAFGDWLMGWLLPRGDDVVVDRYRDEKIYQVPLQRAGKRFTFFLRRGNVFFTSDMETARIAVDRLIADAAPDRAPTALDRLFAETEGGGPMRGAIDNRRGEILRLWNWISSRSESPADRGMWTGFRGLTLAGGLQADGSLAAKLRFVCPDADWAEAHSPDVVQALLDGLAWTDLALDIQARPIGDRIEIELRAPDLADKMQHWLRQAQEIETGSGTVRIDL